MAAAADVQVEFRSTDAVEATAVQSEGAVAAGRASVPACTVLHHVAPGYRVVAVRASEQLLGAGHQHVRSKLAETHWLTAAAATAPVAATCDCVCAAASDSDGVGAGYEPFWAVGGCVLAEVTLGHGVVAHGACDGRVGAFRLHVGHQEGAGQSNIAALGAVGAEDHESVRLGLQGGVVRQAGGREGLTALQA